MPTRRDMLVLLACGSGALMVPGAASAGGDGSYDISYLWSSDLDAVLDYRDQVAEALGPGVAKDLVVVQGRSGNWGLVYDRKGTDLAVARKVAAAHDRLLRSALGGSEVLATAIADSGYSSSYNISYGTLARLADARERFDLIGRILGPDVLKKLVIEPDPSGGYAVVYRRNGDAASTGKVATRHHSLVRAHGASAKTIPDRHVDAVWGSSSTDQRLVASNVSTSGTSGRKGSATLTAASVAPGLSGTKAAESLLRPSTEPPEPKATKTAAAVVATEPSPLPTAPPSSAALPAAVDTPIRDAINAHVQSLRKAGRLSPDETTSWYVHSLHDERTWVALNAERSLQCASMVKPFVALAFLHLVGEGKLIYGPVSKAKLEVMIQRSSNAATNWAIEKVGGPAATQRLLKAHYSSLVQETRIVEAIPAYGRTYKNRSSARDYVRFCRAMWRGDLGCHKELKRLMSLPSRDRLVTGVSSFPSETKVFNKTGSTSHLCGDFGVIVVPDQTGREIPYSFVGIIEKRGRAKSYGAWISSRTAVIRSVSALTYRQLKPIYDLA